MLMSKLFDREDVTAHQKGWKPRETSVSPRMLKKSSELIDGELEDLLQHRQSQEARRWRQANPAAGIRRRAAYVCSLIISLHLRLPTIITTAIKHE